MLLTKTQKKILELIREYGGMKAEMLFKLCEQPFNFAQSLRELFHCKKLFAAGNYICDEEMTICRRETEKAFEIMILLTSDGIELFTKGTPPFELTFFKTRKDKLIRYDVCIVKSGNEIMLSAQLESIIPDNRTICFVLDSLANCKMIKVSCDYCFAVKDGEKYHFYKEV